MAARFCGNCGAPIDNNAKVCSKCGAPVENDIKPSSLKVVNSEKSKKVFKMIVAVVVLVAVATTAINVAVKFTGYNGLTRKVMAAYEKYDIDTLVSLSSDIYYYDDEEYVENYFKDSIGRMLDLFDSTIGHNYKLSYDVNETYKMSERKMRETIEEIEGIYPDFDVSSIQKIVVADITVKASQGNTSVESDLHLTMSKENGAWKLLYME